jgi:hypothetical protein
MAARSNKLGSHLRLCDRLQVRAWYEKSRQGQTVVLDDRNQLQYLLFVASQLEVGNDR